MEIIALKKKHSKTGEESRFQGTVLGIGATSKAVRIDGGPASLSEWMALVKENQALLVTKNIHSKESEDLQMEEG
jgi:transcription initiation factor TFIID subunit 3